MRSAVAALLVASLAGTPALADIDDQGTLAPGGAAGVQQAQDIDLPLIISVVGVAGAAAAVIILVSNANGNSKTTTSTSP
jgi:hypothetical protein